MDYETKPTSRKDLRKLARILRWIFDVLPNGALPVLDMLDKLPDVFPGSNYIIVKDDELPARTMAQCTPNDIGGYDDRNQGIRI